MFFSLREKKEINVRVKFFSGLHMSLELESYDLGKGITMKTRHGEKLERLLKKIKMPDPELCIYFINGEQSGLGHRLKDGDEISCFRPGAGG